MGSKGGLCDQSCAHKGSVILMADLWGRGKGGLLMGVLNLLLSSFLRQNHVQR